MMWPSKMTKKIVVFCHLLLFVCDWGDHNVQRNMWGNYFCTWRKEKKLHLQKNCEFWVISSRHFVAEIARCSEHAQLDTLPTLVQCPQNGCREWGGTSSTLVLHQRTAGQLTLSGRWCWSREGIELSARCCQPHSGYGPQAKPVGDIACVVLPVCLLTSQPFLLQRLHFMSNIAFRIICNGYYYTLISLKHVFKY